ncbi:MAG: GAF domain-containing protein [Kofleriaceae bacterium]
MADTTLSARFYRLLLDLPCHPRPADAVGDALALLAGLTRACIAYVELYNDQGVAGFSRAHGVVDHDLEVVRGAISRGIIGHALTCGETIASASAVHDKRFKALGSVQQHQTAAVLCSPIGLGDGVVYLQGRNDARTFELHDREDVVLFARQLAPMTLWLVDGRPTFVKQMQTRKRQVIAEALYRNEGNVTAAARDLGVGRALVHRVMRRT